MNSDRSLDQIKLQFLANISHELRTPLTGLSGAADLLGMTPLSEEQRQYLHIFKNSSQKLLNIINNLLDYSNLTAGRFQLEEGTFDLHLLLENSFIHCENEAQRKGLVLSYRIAPEVPQFFYGDKLRISQLLDYVISNAIKFTDRGFVCVDVNRDDASIYFCIKDSGVGMAACDREQVFDAFFQSDSSHSRMHEGIGLGLSLAKNLAVMMGGDITLVSERDIGSEFNVRLPYKQLPPKTLDGSTSTRPNMRARIMLVEDNEINQAIVFLLFRKKGLSIDIAANGREGIALHRKHHYDLILMDMQMPQMNGLEATRAIREFDSKVQIVALTANLLPEVQKECLSAGMNYCLTKPLHPSYLESVLSKLQTD